MRFAYCGDDTFLNVLQTLSSRHELLSLFTRPERDGRGPGGVVGVARAAGAEVVVAPMGDAHVQGLRRAGCEFLVAASYPHRIPNLSGAVPYALNVHPSVLPLGRGPWPAPWFFLKDLDRAGVTVHQLSPAWDQGDILAQATYELDATHDVHHVSARSRILGGELVLDVVGDLGASFAARRPQGPGGDYWPSPGVADRSVDFSMPTSVIARRLRAFGKFGVFVKWAGRPHRVRRAVTWPEKHSSAPGRIVLENSEEILFATAGGYLLVQDAEEIRRRPAGAEPRR